MSEVTFTLDGVGKIEMIGNGPWSLVSVGSGAEVRDVNGLVANPTVHQRFSGTGTKPNRNVIFAKPAVTAAIVEAANAHLPVPADAKSAPAAPSPKTKVDG